MKISPALVLVLGVIAVAGRAQTSSAPIKIETKEPPPKVTTPAKKDPKAKDAKVDPKVDAKKEKDAKKKKEDEIGKIDGMEISRGDKGYLGIQVVGGTWKLSFYDKKKKPKAPDVARAIFRWDAKYKLGEERVVLNPGGGMNSMTAGKPVRPPLTFKLFITLLVPPAPGAADEGAEVAGETFTVDFRGDTSAAPEAAATPPP